MADILNVDVHADMKSKDVMRKECNEGKLIPSEAESLST